MDFTLEILPTILRIFAPKNTWVQKVFKTSGINPLICKKYNSTLTLVEISHFHYSIIFPKEFSP